MHVQAEIAKRSFSAGGASLPSTRRPCPAGGGQPPVEGSRWRRQSVGLDGRVTGPGRAQMGYIGGNRCPFSLFFLTFPPVCQRTFGIKVRAASPETLKTGENEEFGTCGCESECLRDHSNLPGSFKSLQQRLPTRAGTIMGWHRSARRHR